MCVCFVFVFVTLDRLAHIHMYIYLCVCSCMCVCFVFVFVTLDCLAHSHLPSPVNQHTLLQREVCLDNNVCQRISTHVVLRSHSDTPHHSLDRDNSVPQAQVNGRAALKVFRSRVSQLHAMFGRKSFGYYQFRWCQMENFSAGCRVPCLVHVRLHFVPERKVGTALLQKISHCLLLRLYTYSK